MTLRNGEDRKDQCCTRQPIYLRIKFVCRAVSDTTSLHPKEGTGFSRFFLSASQMANTDEMHALCKQTKSLYPIEVMRVHPALQTFVVHGTITEPGADDLYRYRLNKTSENQPDLSEK